MTIELEINSSIGQIILKKLGIDLLTSFTFQILALALLGIGIYCEVAGHDDLNEAIKKGVSDPDAQKVLLDIIEKIATGGKILIIYSSILFVSTIIGLCGASSHNRCLLGIYFGLISILIIGLAVITIVAKTSLLDEFQNDLKNCTGCDTVKGQINFIEGITLPVLIGIMAALVIE